MCNRCRVPSSRIPRRFDSPPLTSVFVTGGVLLVTLASSACGPAVAASASERSSYEQRALTPTGRQSSSDRVTRQELSAFDGANFLEALRRLRPDWTRPSPTTRQSAEPGAASVYVNDGYVGGLDALRLIPIDAVTDVRYLTPSAARTWFGMFCPCAGGAILVSTRTDE